MKLNQTRIRLIWICRFSIIIDCQMLSIYTYLLYRVGLTFSRVDSVKKLLGDSFSPGLMASTEKNNTLLFFFEMTFYSLIHLKEPNIFHKNDDSDNCHSKVAYVSPPWLGKPLTSVRLILFSILEKFNLFQPNECH